MCWNIHRDYNFWIFFRVIVVKDRYCYIATISHILPVLCGHCISKLIAERSSQYNKMLGLFVCVHLVHLHRAVRRHAAHARLCVT